MKQFKKIMASFLILCLVIGMIPASAITAFAAEEESLLAAELAEAKAFTDALTINNESNDPETVVKNFKTHFTWDNEKRENKQSYLYDWSYYNGVVFEGIEYLYEVTGENVYKEYVEEYMSSLIASNGTWATCSNNSSKQCAGYNSTHGADCYKTASLLLDAYEMTKDSRYLTMAATLYADLDTAAKTYSLSNAGKNYRHTWSSDPSPDLWLDGLYMILPFRAEYAKYINDTEELDLIVARMQWVSDNMYNKEKGLFYHAADSATSNSGTYWLRAIGWYAAAIVDIMDSMEGENLEAMKAQLVKLVDGMKACQNTSNGMWLNNMAADESSTNPYETSGTALTCYAVMKAVNEGWLDESYADMAISAFKGICEYKLDGNTLKDICFKGAPGSSNSTIYNNEGKGVGPFIMFYAEVLEYVNNQKEEPETPVVPEEPETPVVPEEPETDNTITVKGNEIRVEGVTGLTGGEVNFAAKALIALNNYNAFVAYDINATLTGDKATVSVPVPAEWNATEDELVGISVENGIVKEIKGTLSADGSQAAVQAAFGLETISPTIIFGKAISGFFAAMGFGEAAVNVTYTIICLAVSCFCLTSLDTATRLGRFMFQELFATKKNGEKNILSNMYVATIVTVLAALALTVAGYTKIWPLFGACNQLVAVPAFLAIATYLQKIGKNNKMLYFPIIFMSIATLTSLVLTFKNNLMAIIGGGLDGAAMFTNVLQDVIIIPIVILAVILIVEGSKVLWGKKNA